MKIEKNQPVADNSKKTVKPFQHQSPSQNLFEHNSYLINGDNLFSIFTADIIKRRIVFTR